MKIVLGISVLANILLLLACGLLVLRPVSGMRHAADVPVLAKPPAEPRVQVGKTLDGVKPSQIPAAQALLATSLQVEGTDPVSRRAKDDLPRDSNNPIEVFAVQAPFVAPAERAYPISPPAEVVALLKNKRAMGQTDHFGFLLEYGLRVHQKYLEYTRLARELPLEENPMLAELVRLTQLAEYASAHEAGWLDRQFDNRFGRRGHSSYQIYIWAKEHAQDWLDESQFPNWRRIGEIMEAIDKSGRSAVGGDGVCHYGCVP